MFYGNLGAVLSQVTTQQSHIRVRVHLSEVVSV